MHHSRRSSRRKQQSARGRAPALQAKTHLDEAAGHLKSGNYHRALTAYSKALELRPEDKGALVARSKCYLLLGQPQLALEDAEAALRVRPVDPENTPRPPTYSEVKKSEIVRCSAIFQKAEALYQLGDFEHSLMFHHRGLRLRPELDGFRLGVQKAQQAIQNTIGGKTLLCSLEPPPAAQEQQQQQQPQPQPEEETPDDSQPETAATSAPSSGTAAGRRSASAAAHHGASPTPGPGTGTGSGSRPASGSAGAGDPAARRLLGALCVDKQYLEQLLRNPDIKCLRQDAASHILTEAEEGIEFLKTREEFWRQQRPMQANNKKKKKH